MPATAARIGFITEEWRRAVAETPAVKTRYGSNARASEDPIPTFFDNVADAQTVATERQTLLSAERRMFEITLIGVADVLALDYTGQVPIATYTDAERSVSALSCLVAQIGVDFRTETSTLRLWG